VDGIVENSYLQQVTGMRFNDPQVPYQIKQLMAEALFYLLRHGYIAPKGQDSYQNAPVSHNYNVTERGREWFDGAEPLPEDAKGYMDFLRQLVPTRDPVIDQYIVEALVAFEHESYFATAVMVGAASEKAIYLLATSLLVALMPSPKRARLEGLMKKRSLNLLLENVRETIGAACSGNPPPIPYAASEGAAAHLPSLFEAIRTQRNDAVHPMNGMVSAPSVRMLLRTFPYALSTTESLRSWCEAHPGSL
jgi:hypothetical protein